MDIMLFLYWFLMIYCMPGNGEDYTQEHMDIWCLNDQDKRLDKLMENIQNDKLCQYRSIKIYPYSDEIQDSTPVKPERFDADFDTYMTVIEDSEPSQQIAVSLSWLYRKDYFDYVEGFHMEINAFQQNDDNRQIKFYWGSNLLNAVNGSSANMLRFHFIYAGEPKSYIKPGNLYRFRLQPLPLYGPDNKMPQDIRKTVKIPDCDHPVIKKSDQCDHTNCDGENCVPLNTTDETMHHTTTYQMTNLQKSSSTDTLMCVAIVGGFIALVLISMLIFFWNKKFCGFSEEDGSVETGGHQILLVCTADQGFIGPINHLIEMLLQYSHTKVVCNLRQKTEIGNQGIQEWTKKEVSAADIVCFAVANPYEVKKVHQECDEMCRLDNVENQQVAVVLGATETIIVNSKKENDEKKFVILDLSNFTSKNSSPYFKWYKLPGDMKKFLKHTLGEYNGTKKEKLAKAKKTFLNQLSNAQHHHAKENTVTQHQTNNNLNPKENDVSKDNWDASLSLNIDPDGPQSCNGEQPASYQTTDFNIENEARYQKFVLAGARPKQLNNIPSML